MIIQSSELPDVRHHHQSETIALRFGCYDILHAGHQKGIDYAKSQADVLVVGVMPDIYVRKHKGDCRPVRNQEDRAASIDSADNVDYVFVTGKSRISIAHTILQLMPDVYVEENAHSELRYIKSPFLSFLGVQHTIDNLPRVSSSSAIIATLGLEHAVANSALTYLPEPR